MSFVSHCQRSLNASSADGNHATLLAMTPKMPISGSIIRLFRVPRQPKNASNNLGAIWSCLTFFHTHSLGLSSGE